LKQAPIEAVTPTGDVVAMTEVVEPPPVETAALQPMEPKETMKTMPQTASLLPLFGLIGLLSLAAGAVLWLIPNRPA
jgi:hypothetical protein